MSTSQRMPVLDRIEAGKLRDALARRIKDVICCFSGRRGLHPLIERIVGVGCRLTVIHRSDVSLGIVAVEAVVGHVARVTSLKDKTWSACQTAPSVTGPSRLLMRRFGLYLRCGLSPEERFDRQKQSNRHH